MQYDIQVKKFIFHHGVLNIIILVQYKLWNAFIYCGFKDNLNMFNVLNEASDTSISAYTSSQH